MQRKSLRKAREVFKYKGFIKASMRDIAGEVDMRILRPHTFICPALARRNGLFSAK